MNKIKLLKISICEKICKAFLWARAHNMLSWVKKAIKSLFHKIQVSKFGTLIIKNNNMNEEEQRKDLGEVIPEDTAAHINDEAHTEEELLVTPTVEEEAPAPDTIESVVEEMEVLLTKMDQDVPGMCQLNIIAERLKNLI
tara:strand:- start:662 stop:1081 length:420 start_codon:yes stop_codon:yes gene_type:complete